MELSGMLVWAAVLVSLIVFIILLVKGFKNWGVGMTIGFVILFIECWVFLLFSAGVNDYRLKALKEFDVALNENIKLKADKELELYGRATDPIFDKQRFVSLASELNRVLLERGRTWRGVRVIDAANPNRIVVQLPNNNDNVAPGESGAPAANQAGVRPTDPLSVDSVIYVFGEDNLRIPRAYLGEFKVTTVTPDGLTLVPTAPLAPNQIQNLNAGPNWAIYEVMPLDSHTAFAEQGSVPTPDEIFGHMNREEISKTLGIPLELSTIAITPSTDLATAIRARVLQSYLNNGMQAREGTSLDNTIYEVTFLKDYTETVDASTGRNPTEGGFFDATGRSIDARLMRSDDPKVSSAAGETYRLYGPKAKQLEQEGIVKLGQAYYARPLNDYEFSFRETRRLTQQAMQELALVNREIEITTKADADARKQQLLLEEDARKLELDKSQHSKELAVVQNEVKRTTDMVNSKRKELSKIFGDIRTAHAALIQSQSSQARPASALDAVTSR